MKDKENPKSAVMTAYRAGCDENQDRDGVDIRGIPAETEYPKAFTDRFELLECFSSHLYAETLLVKERGDGTLRVAKCYHPESPLFNRTEPEILQRLQASPLPRFITEYRTESMRVCVREYIEGETLKDIAARKSFSEEEIRLTGIHLCKQLRAIHSQDPPVIHRDIKPQNVVVKPDGSPVLIDFGITWGQHEGKTDTIILGTQDFAPPEQYGFRRTDARSDIYSLGVLLNWMRCQKAEPLEHGETPLEKVIEKCTAFDPAGRYPDAIRLQKALESAVPAGGRKKLFAVGILLLLAAAILLGRMILQKRDAIVFEEPTIEAAARASLGISEEQPLTQEMLQQITDIYVIANSVCKNEDDFFMAVNQWYSDGKPDRGDIHSLEDLRKMKNLERICLAAQEISDLSSLEDLEKLERIEVKHNYIEDIGVLAGKDHLVWVGINDNPVRDISPLLECPNLCILDLCDVQSYDASVIGELGNFDFLDISNPTDSCRYLAGKSIRSLKLNWSSLQDLEDLSEVNGLSELEISHTLVADLSPLAKHTGLKVLRISYIPVQDLSVLKELPQLERVTLNEEMHSLAEALGEVTFDILYEN
ncbi:MAG: protein kinase [Lachnospiraceae bacterium]|nr:protein kinase [Lachnospiraceae bacterium]